MEVPLPKTSVRVYNPASNDAVTKRSFLLGVLMLLHRTVTQSPVPVVSGINVRLEVLAVAFAEGCCCACPVATVNGRARHNANNVKISLLFFIV